MSGLDLTTGDVIIFFALLGRNLSLCEDNAFLSNLCFECFESEFEGLKFVPEPD